MKFCSIDVEADQPSGQIIQIGAVIYIMNKNKINIISEFNQYLDWGMEPNWNHLLRYGQTTLGELLQPMRNEYDQYKMPHKKVFENFWTWADQHNIKYYIQWGSGDMKDIKKQSFSKRHATVINLKHTYASIFAPLMGKKRMGLFNTCKKFGMDFVGSNHNALDDAKNTALLHAKMIDQIDLRDTKKNPA